MRHPEKVGSDDLQELEVLVNRYPYFQTARMLYLKVLYLQAGTRFMHELKRSTVHITDHKQLLHYLNLLPGTHLRNVTSAPHDVPAEAAIYTQDELSTESNASPDTTGKTTDATDKEEESIVSLNFEALQDKTAETPSHPASGHIPDIKPLTLDLETEDSEANDDTFVIPEIISAGYSLTEEEDFSDSERHTDTKNKNDRLIDSFIENSPSIPKASETSEDTRDLSEENPYAQDELFTETLAKIYTKQKLYDKAITTYIKLSLKYPEKSVYFANRIEKIKEIINNQE